MVSGTWDSTLKTRSSDIPKSYRQMRAETEKVFARRKNKFKEIHPSDFSKAPQTLCFVQSLIEQTVEQLGRHLPELELNGNQYVSKWHLSDSLAPRGDFVLSNGGEMSDLRKLTLVYFMNPEIEENDGNDSENDKENATKVSKNIKKKSKGGQWEMLTEQREENGELSTHSSLVEPQNDRLLVFWSDSVMHRVLPSENVAYLSISLFTTNPKSVGKHLNPDFNGFLTPLRSDLKVEYFKHWAENVNEDASSEKDKGEGKEGQ